MATAHLLRRASSAFLSSTTTGPLSSRCPLPRRLRQPRAAMATDSSAAPFQKIQIQREDTVRGPALTLSPPPALSSVSYLSTRKTRRLGRAFLGFSALTSALSGHSWFEFGSRFAAIERV